MKTGKNKLIALSLVVLFGAMASVGVAWANHPTRATARLIDTNGLSAGTVTFQVIEGKMAVTANVLLPRQFAGFHGFHLHRIGKCDPNATDNEGKRSPFLSASGHIGSEDAHNHGLHDGDLPPLLVNRDGHARMSVRTDHISFDRLFDADGTAVMIHLDPDNFAHIPSRYAPNGPDAATLATGDAGGRTVCGVVARG
ncbi:MAG: superoxide dismutase family protein [Actinobacteria bacterium]|nr:superoxide dismutase family protein [Actinomycetota bacterium]